MAKKSSAYLGIILQLIKNIFINLKLNSPGLIKQKKPETAKRRLYRHNMKYTIDILKLMISAKKKDLRCI